MDLQKDGRFSRALSYTQECSHLLRCYPRLWPEIEIYTYKFKLDTLTKVFCLSIFKNHNSWRFIHKLLIPLQLAELETSFNLETSFKCHHYYYFCEAEKYCLQVLAFFFFLVRLNYTFWKQKVLGKRYLVFVDYSLILHQASSFTAHVN